MGQVSEKLDKLVDEVLKLSVLEVSEFTSIIAEKAGIDLNAVAAAPAAAPAAGGDAGGAEEKSEFNVILESFGDKKIDVIKVVNGILNVGLREAKEFVEAAPKPLKEGVKKEEAEEIKKKLEDAGAKVTLS